MATAAEYEAYLKKIEQLMHEDREKLRAKIIERNAVTLAIHQEAWQKTQAGAYRQSLVQLSDARFESQELDLQSQEFLIESGQRAQTQVARYAASGAMVAGSAMSRLDMTRSLGAEGARRLMARSELAMERGERAAQATLDAAIEPMYVPDVVPDSLLDPDSEEAINRRSGLVDTIKSIGGGGGGGGGTGGGAGGGTGGGNGGGSGNGGGGTTETPLPTEQENAPIHEEDVSFVETDPVSGDDTATIPDPKTDPTPDPIHEENIDFTTTETETDPLPTIAVAAAPTLSPTHELGPDSGDKGDSVNSGPVYDNTVYLGGEPEHEMGPPTNFGSGPSGITESFSNGGGASGPVDPPPEPLPKPPTLPQGGFGIP